MLTSHNRLTNSKKKPLNQYAQYAGMGFTMAAVMLLMIWGGYKLDDYFQLQNPVFTIILTLLSIPASLYLSLKDLLKKK